ncbi:hypothetical protein BGZ76_005928 [Entomortierella beljakovae]|nr:hypothetical protein BGZ76_005928 [Entomortierella beljakovae]
MNPFTVVSYCQNNLPSLPSLPSTLLQRRSSSGTVNVVVHTSPKTPRKIPQQPQKPISHSPHTTINSVIEEEEEQIQKSEVPVVRPRNNPQAILPEFENDGKDFYPPFSQVVDEIDETDKVLNNKNRHSIHAIPVSAVNDTLEDHPKKYLQRSTSFHTVHTTPPAPERASLDSFDRARILKPSSSDAIQATTMVSQPRPIHLRHLRSNSTPSLLASPTLKPSVQSPSSLSISSPNIPAISSEASNEDSSEPENEEQAEKNDDDDDDDDEYDGNNKMEEKEEEKEDKDQSIPQAPVEAKMEPNKPSLVAMPPTPTHNVPSTVSSIPASVPQPSTEQKMSTPTVLSPVVAPAVQNIPVSLPSPSNPSTLTPSPNPIPHVAPPTSPSVAPSAPQSTASSFLSSWHGRSRTMIPTIPRPTPLMSFSAARSVVSSVKSAGTGFLLTKETLESIPMANRILKHPVMDSTLSYIATKATERGISLGLNNKNLIAPEDVPYRKLNKNMVQQAMTLSVLAVQKEEQSKATDDEAADDAFELYLASVNTLLHSIPFETCDPLRKEAFGIQLRNFMEAYLDQELDGYLSDTGSSAKLRRKGRRRHRRYNEQATTMIQQHTANADENAISEQRTQQKQQRMQRRAQHAKEKQAQKKLKQQMEKELKNQKPSKQSSPSIAPQQTKGRRDSSSSVQQGTQPQQQPKSRRRRRSNSDNQQGSRGARRGNTNNNSGLTDTIISTAVTSAIRLKQSPIPDVVKSCFQTSKTIFNKVDERFHLQDKAWEISKSSIEKAIELDEQYAIHEVVTDTMFATLTGLVKAGIAYKESPSYSTIKASAAAGSIEGATVPAITLSSAGRSQNPQEMKPSKKSRESAKSKRPLSSKDTKQVDNNADKSGFMRSWGRKSVAPVVESDSEYDSEVDSGEEYDSDESEGSSMTSSRSSDLSSDQDSDEGETDVAEEEVIELNNQTLRSKLASTSGGREKIDMFSALRGAASLVYNTM